MKRLLFLAVFMLYFSGLHDTAYCQTSCESKLAANTIFHNFREHYDGGFLLAGETPAWYNLNLGLITKADINGFVLWKKVVREKGWLLLFNRLWPTIDNGLIASGISKLNDTTVYPIFIKFNSCGEIEWSKKIQTNGEIGDPDIVQFPDGSYVGLVSAGIDYYNGYSYTTLINMDSYGSVMEIDTLALLNGETNLIGGRMLLLPDNHIHIITSQPYLGGSSLQIKTDKHAGVDWVLQINSGGSGILEAVTSGDETLYGSGFRMYAPNDDHAMLYKYRDGSFIWTKPPLPGQYSYCTGTICFVNDSTLVLGISPYPSANQSIAVVDSSGAIRSQEPDTLKSLEFRLTSDQKIMARKYFGQTSITPLVKYRMNQTMDSIAPDSLYLAPRIYDYNCAYPILNDTVEVLPEIITGIEHRTLSNTGNNNLLLIPNPARQKVDVAFPDEVELPGLLSISTVDGKYLHSIEIVNKLDLKGISVSELCSGVFLFKFQSGNGKLYSGRMVKLVK